MGRNSFSVRRGPSWLNTWGEESSSGMVDLWPSIFSPSNTVKTWAKIIKINFSRTQYIHQKRATNEECLLKKGRWIFRTASAPFSLLWFSSSSPQSHGGLATQQPHRCDVCDEPSSHRRGRNGVGAPWKALSAEKYPYLTSGMAHWKPPLLVCRYSASGGTYLAQSFFFLGHLSKNIWRQLLNIVAA